jgi:hypothetical protein
LNYVESLEKTLIKLDKILMEKIDFEEKIIA